jgi:hypothetical protein
VSNKKRNKYPASAKTRTEARRVVIKAGEYNGGSASSEFMVTGHSTGSPYSEMEELSEQLTRDVGGLPYHPVEFAKDQSSTGYDGYEGEGLGDLGGPEFYGNKPYLLKKSPLHRAGTSRGLAIGAAVGLAATAVLGGLAFFFRENLKQETRRPVHAAKRKTTRAHVAATPKAKPAAKRLKKTSRPAVRAAAKAAGKMSRPSARA